MGPDPRQPDRHQDLEGEHQPRHAYQGPPDIPVAVRPARLPADQHSDRQQCSCNGEQKEPGQVEPASRPSVVACATETPAATVAREARLRHARTRSPARIPGYAQANPPSTATGAIKADEWSPTDTPGSRQATASRITYAPRQAIESRTVAVSGCEDDPGLRGMLAQRVVPGGPGPAACASARRREHGDTTEPKVGNRPTRACRRVRRRNPSGSQPRGPGRRWRSGRSVPDGEGRSRRAGCRSSRPRR